MQRGGAAALPAATPPPRDVSPRASGDDRRHDRLLRVQAVLRLVEHTELGEYSTSSVISSPQWAGRQCMTLTCGPASSRSALFTWYSLIAARRTSCSASWPMLVKVSV